MSKQLEKAVKALLLGLIQEGPDYSTTERGTGYVTDYVDMAKIEGLEDLVDLEEDEDD